MTIKNLDLLAPPSPPPITQAALWATVTQVSPLRVQLDGEPGPLPITPDTLVAGLAVGDRVWCQLTTNTDPQRRSRRLVVVGRSGGVAAEWFGYVLRPTESVDTTDDAVEDVPGMAFNVIAGGVYVVELYAAMAGPTAANAKFDWDGDPSHEMRRHLVSLAAGTSDNRSASVMMTRRDMGTDEVVGVGTDSGSGSASYRETCILVAAVSGVIKLRFAQGSTNATATTLASHSFMRIQRVA